MTTPPCNWTLLGGNVFFSNQATYQALIDSHQIPFVYKDHRPCFVRHIKGRTWMFSSLLIWETNSHPEQTHRIFKLVKVPSPAVPEQAWPIATHTPAFFL